MLSGLTLLYLQLHLSIYHAFPKLNTQFFFISKHRVHEFVSGLTSVPKAELFCSSKRRKFTGQNNVKICKL